MGKHGVKAGRMVLLCWEAWHCGEKYGVVMGIMVLSRNAYCCVGKHGKKHGIAFVGIMVFCWEAWCCGEEPS